MQLAEEYYFYPSTERIAKKSSKIYEAMNFLDHFYAIKKMQYSCELFNRSQILQDSIIPILFYKEIKELFQLDSICFQLYKIASDLIEQKEISLFFQLKNLYFNNYLKLDKRDQSIIFHYLINHASYRVKLGEDEFNKEIFLVYKHGIHQQFMIVNSYFDKSSFINIVIIATKNKEFEWGEKFIKKWQNYLMPKIQLDTILICKAYILFEKNKIDETIKLLAEVNSVNFHYSIRANILLISCYLESGDYEPSFILNKCSNFNRIARRNQLIHPTTLKSILNFNKFIKKNLGSKFK